MSDSESWGADFDAPATPVKLSLPTTPQQSAPLLASPRGDADVDDSWEASFDASFETNALDNTPTLVVSISAESCHFCVGALLRLHSCAALKHRRRPTTTTGMPTLILHRKVCSRISMLFLRCLCRCMILAPALRRELWRVVV